MRVAHNELAGDATPMSRSHYNPPVAPVMITVSSGPRARWKWLIVPIGYAALNFFWFLASWWWVQPAESGSLSFSLDVAALKLMAREATYQGGVVLVVTCLLLAALPRIHLGHAVLVSLASVVATYGVFFAAAYLRRPITTNGGQLMSIVSICGVVLLISGVFIRRRNDG
jgi:hypothetical protein